MGLLHRALERDWESCFDEQAVAIDVDGPHILICRSPKALRTVTQTLANGTGAAAADI